jgi:MFS family permease
MTEPTPTRPPPEAVAPRAGEGLTPPVFRLLFFCLSIVGVGNSMLFSVLPPIARETGMPDWAVSAIFTLSAVLWVATSPIWGRVSDEKGRKPLIVLGLSAYAISTLSFTLVATLALAGHWNWLLIFLRLATARSLFGAMGSATNPATQAYVADATPPETRTREIAAVTSAFAFGSAGGPALAALMVAQFGLLAPLWAVSALAGLGALAAALRLPAHGSAGVREAPPLKSAAPGSIWRVASLPAVRPWLIFGIALSAVTAVMGQMLTFYLMDTLDLTPREGAAQAAVAFALGALAQIVAQIGLIPRLSLSPRGLIVAGTIITALGAFLTAAGGTFGVLAAAQMLIGLGFGLARPGFTGGASLAVDPDQQGVIAGLVVAANGAGFVVAPIFGAGLYALVSPQAPFWLCAIVLCLLAGYGLSSRRLRGLPLAESPPDQMAG